MLARQSCVDLDSEGESSATCMFGIFPISVSVMYGNTDCCFFLECWNSRNDPICPLFVFLSRTEGIKTWYFFLIFDGWQITYTTICLQFFWISVNQNLVYDFDVELQHSSSLKWAWSVENLLVWCSEWLAVTDCFECSYFPNHFLFIIRIV